METLRVYQDYCHQMMFLRAALNRVLNFLDSAASTFNETDKAEVERLTLRAYKLQAGMAVKATYGLRDMCNDQESTTEGIATACRSLNQCNRMARRLGQLFEGTIVSGRRGADDFEEDFAPKNMDPSTLSTDLSVFKGELETCITSLEENRH